MSTTVSTRGTGKTVYAAKVSAAEQLRSGIESHERVYLDNNEPRTEAWRPLTVSVQPTILNRGLSSVSLWEADIDWVWGRGEY